MAAVEEPLDAGGHLSADDRAPCGTIAISSAHRQSAIEAGAGSEENPAYGYVHPSAILYPQTIPLGQSDLR